MIKKALALSLMVATLAVLSGSLAKAAPEKSGSSVGRFVLFQGRHLIYRTAAAPEKKGMLEANTGNYQDSVMRMDTATGKASILIYSDQKIGWVAVEE